MAEYFYHKGEIKFKKGKAEDCFKKLVSSEYGKLASEDGSLKQEGDKISIDTVGGGSYPLSYLTDFEDELKGCLGDLARETTLGRFCYGDGYYKLTLKPGARDLVSKKVSDEDPNEVTLKKGEGAVPYSFTDLVEMLEEKVSKDDSLEVMLEKYYEVVKKLLKEGNIVHTPLGSMISMKSQAPGSDDIIATFSYSNPLNK